MDIKNITNDEEELEIITEIDKKIIENNDDLFEIENSKKHDDLGDTIDLSNLANLFGGNNKDE